MNDLNLIAHSLATRPLNPTTFEHCAQDLLQRVYPQLNPIHGGVDWGRDADIPDVAGDRPPIRVLITSARTLKGVRDNQHGSIASMHEHGVIVQRVILVNAAILTNLDRMKLVESAGRQDVLLDPADIYDGGWIESQLRRDGFWRHELLGLAEGSITLTPQAPELAESPWRLSLQGRDSDLADLDQGDDDVILTGMPGVGKSRLASELTDTAFVDKDADVEQIIDELRLTQPRNVVIDDATQALPLIRRLLTARANDADVLKYRLICLTWPDGLELLQATLPSARVQEVGLLERQQIDSILREMGITHTLARGEILNQAEGRPGWAVTLGDLLLRTDDATTLLNGSALVGRVKSYLIRASINEPTAELLAVIAAVGGVGDGEIARLAHSTGVDRITIARALQTAARSGLLDVNQTRGLTIGTGFATQVVRPPMLATALATELIFDATAPVTTFDELTEEWADHAIELANTAVRASHLGSTNARTATERAMATLLANPSDPAHELTELIDLYALLDRPAGERALTWLEGRLAETTPDMHQLRDQLLEVVADIAGRHRIAAAFDLLFEAVTTDTRPTNQNPNHPLRLLQTMISGYHPELPHDHAIRRDIADRLRQWSQGAAARQSAAGQVVELILNLEIESAHTDPGDPMTLHLYRGVLPADDINRLLDELWPLIEDQLTAGNDDLSNVLLDTAETWLFMGTGLDGPLHPDTVAAAQHVGTQLLDRLAARTELTRGHQTRMHAIGDRFGHDTGTDPDDELAPFFRAIDRRGEDIMNELTEVEADVARVASNWATRAAGEVATQLSDLRTELRKAKLNLPDRIQVASNALAQQVDDPIEWLDNFEAHELHTESNPFILRAIDDGSLTEDRARRLLGEPSHRRSLIAHLIATEEPPPWAPEVLADLLRPDDIDTIQLSLLRDELTPGMRDTLLTQTEPLTRGLIALSLVQNAVHNGLAWDDGPTGAQTTEALEGLELENLPHMLHSAEPALNSIVDRQPDLATTIFKSAIARGGAAAVHRPRGNKTDPLSRLPEVNRTEIWRSIDSTGSRSWILGRLIGTDLAWATSLIDEGLATTEQVLTALSRVDAKPPLAAIADALIPRGASPDAIAALRLFGTFTGPQSANHQAAINEFQGILETATTDAARRVAEAGIELFTAARDKAADQERQARIRGER